MLKKIGYHLMLGIIHEVVYPLLNKLVEHLLNKDEKLSKDLLDAKINGVPVSHIENKMKKLGKQIDTTYNLIQKSYMKALSYKVKTME